MSAVPAGGCAPPVHIPDDIGVEAGLAPSWFAREEKDPVDGPAFVGSAGVRVNVFPDGAVALFIGEGEPRERSATVLNAAQAKQLAGFFRILTPATDPPSVLDEARDIVHGDRERTHGEPAHNLRAIAGVWTALLAAVLKPGCTVTPEIVSLLMIGLKLARACNQPSHRDHWIDIAGYVALAERCGYVAPK